MLVARQKMVTPSMDLPESPKGRVLKHASAAAQFLLRTKAINSKLHLAPACFRSRRDTIDLFRGSLGSGQVRTVLILGCLAILCSCMTDDAVSKRKPGQQHVCHKGRTLAVTTADMFGHQNHGDTL